MQNALKMSDEGNQETGDRVARYLSQKSLQPFIYKDKKAAHFEPLICYKGESKINGYEATILLDICDGFLDARKNIKLSPRQEIIAHQAEILMRSFAKVGVTGILRALISILVGEYREFIRNFRSVFVNKSDTYAAKRSNYSNSSSDNNIPYAEWWVVDETIPTEKEMFLTEETILYEEMKNSVW